MWWTPACVFLQVGAPDRSIGSPRGSGMSGSGELLCEGWLRKSPPEKKLRRFVSNKVHFLSVFLKLLFVFYWLNGIDSDRNESLTGPNVCFLSVFIQCHSRCTYIKNLWRDSVNITSEWRHQTSFFSSSHNSNTFTLPSQSSKEMGKYSTVRNILTNIN